MLPNNINWGMLYLGKTPLLVQLNEFNSAEGKMNIIRDISTKFNLFGPALLNDRTGSVVDGIRREKLGNTIDTTSEIVSRWLNGEGAPVTWDKLVDCLYHANLNVIAKKIENCLI